MGFAKGNQDSAKVAPRRSRWHSATTFSRLLVYAKPSKVELAILLVAFISAIASGVPFPVLAIIYGQLVNDLNSATCDVTPSSAPAYGNSINEKVLLVVYVGIAYFSLMYISIFAWNLSAEKLAQRLRERYLASMLRQDATYFDTMTAGQVSSRINEDVATIQQGTNEKVGIVISSTSFFVTAYIVAFTMDAKLAAMLVSLTPAYLLMAFGGGYFTQKYFAQSIESLTNASAVALEAFQNLTIVHAFSANVRLEENFVTALSPGLTNALWKSLCIATQAGLLYFIAFSANALAFWQGSQRLADALENNIGGITIGQTYTVILVLVDGSLVLSQAAVFLQNFSAASAAFCKLESDMDHVSKIDGTKEDEGTSPPAVTGTLKLQDVVFAYPSAPDKHALQKLSLEFPAGQQTALVGLSGSGKSTITQLLTRFYDPSAGRVLLDDHDIVGLNVRFLRSQIGLVEQEPRLFHRSILENIAIGLINSPAHAHLQEALMGDSLSKVAETLRAGTDFERTSHSESPQIREIFRLVQDSAATANASEFIDLLDDGYGTTVGPQGSLISGGQKQRIALARALIKNPRVLILDEATASLDAASELLIQDAITRIAAGRTIISVAHRLSTIKHSDNIIVMRQGTVIEQGKHEELIQLSGHYAELVRLQNSETEATTNEEPSTTVESPSNESITTAEKSAALQDSSTSNDEAVTGGDSTSCPSHDPMESRSESSVLRPLGALTRPYAFLLVIASIGAAVIGATYCFSAVIFGKVVGKLSPCETPAEIRDAGNLYSLLFFMLAILEFLANFFSWSIFGWIAEQIVHKVRVLTLRSVLEQDLAWHEASDRNPAMLLALVTKDSGALNGLAGSVICTILSVIVSLIATITMTHIIAWRIAVVCLAVVPLLLGAGYMRVSTLAHFEETHSESFANSNAITIEAIDSIRTVMSFGLERNVLETYRRSLQGPVKQAVKNAAWANLWLAIGYGLSNFLYALAYYWGSKQIIAGRYTQTQFFIVIIALLVSSQLWGQAFALAPDISRAFKATERLMKVLRLGSATDLSKPLDSPPDVEAAAVTSEKGLTARGGIDVTFKDVKFSYPARPYIRVLHGLNLHIQTNQFVALVGPSGAGKSTIVSLIERLYQPLSGSISIDNKDIAYSDGTFRHDISYVPQQSVLFNDTVRFNLLLGARPDHTPTQQDLEDACKLANIHEVIVALPQGYDSPVGPNGDRLSGGQKQRLALARALVRKPRLLLLDESTSALDAESEHLLRESLKKATVHTTVIAIAHRLHTIKEADVIFLIEKGACVDSGTHEELLVRSESYRLNVANQAV
ncbi:multidrug resistance protein 1, 2, 3 [Elsinoe ampelina]|uniref:Multidrug resistance protein 1, 2, 3 n=1 Tax=Elsinoe ampelina TaxID=302913 RepID=A0A6A6G4U9_9PEZI|nr:multidrug resistance protein 1, 2, 3 [Elsinoe ampelina]